MKSDIILYSRPGYSVFGILAEAMEVCNQTTHDVWVQFGPKSILITLEMLNRILDVGANDVVLMFASTSEPNWKKTRDTRPPVDEH